MRIRNWITILLVFGYCQLVMAECGDQVENIKVELNSIKRLNKVLNSEDCLRLPTEDERVLYTWGHKDKFKNLQAWPYAQFKIYNQAQQYAYAGIKAKSHFFTEITGDVEVLENFLFGLKSTYGTATVGELFQYSSDPEYLISIQNYWLKSKAANNSSVLMLKVPMYRGEVDKTKLFTMTKAAYEGLLALAMDQLNPGFIKNINKPLDQLIRETELQVDSANNDRELRVAEGRLLGYLRAQKSASDPAAKLSNISYGPAVYFGLTAGASVSHYYDKDHAGRACTLNEQVRITDISGPKIQKILLKKGVFIKSKSNPETKAIYPGGYNELSNPAVFRTVMEARLMKFGGVYADNGLIDYVADCRPIRLNDFTECPSVINLTQKGQFYGTKDNVGPLYNFLNPNNEGRHLDRFLHNIANCAVSDNNQAPYMCKALNDGGFLTSKFYSDNKQQIDLIRNNCG